MSGLFLTACLSLGAIALLDDEQPLEATALSDSADAGEWIRVDDPDFHRLPVALEKLPYVQRTAYESLEEPTVLLVRRLEPTEEVIDAFVADEELLQPYGELIPEGEDFFEVGGREGMLFECSWQLAGVPSQAIAYYLPIEDATLSVLLVTTGDTKASKLAKRVRSLAKGFAESLHMEDETRYRAQLLTHELSFQLRIKDKHGTIQFERAAETAEVDRSFHTSVMDANPQFKDAYVGDWVDERNGLTLSYQLIQHDSGMGPEDPLTRWLAGQLQTSVRGEKELGDAPVEELHLPEAQTAVVSEEEIARHYAAAVRAPEAGVILKTYIPRSPYSRVYRVRWHDPETLLENTCLLLEIRRYPRGRIGRETVMRSNAVLLFARAEERELLDRWEAGLAFRSRPFEERPAPFAHAQ